MGRGKRREQARVALSTHPRTSTLPPVLEQALRPTEKRLLKLALAKRIRALDPYFTSTRRMAAACGQMEITFLPWRNAVKYPSDPRAIERIERLIDFLPRLVAVTGSAKEAGLWLTSPHYGFETKARYGAMTPAVALRDGLEEEVLARAADDFNDGSQEHRQALTARGHTLLEEGRIRLKDTLRDTFEEPQDRTQVPYFHFHPRAGKTIDQK
jgi:hypothetical protein